MYFKKIDLHGFKSFAEPVSIVFHEGITCIVGPNGSGKSNISDAIRWVLGEQSPKMLRGGKMEEVIFAGTASRKSRGMAEVTLVIDNSTGILPIDYTEVAITRRMYRSGESEYSINNNPCRLKDIRELIMDTGIGVDGYSLIGQGKIADIVSSKPESRREIFEEAAGVVKYRSRKAEAERKLLATSHNLERVNDIIGEIEGRIDQLREDSEKAAEFLALREQYKIHEINITLKNIETVILKNEYLKDELIEAEEQIDQYKQEKASLEEQLRVKRSEQQALEQRINELRDQILVIVEEGNTFLNQTQLNRERRETLDRDQQRLERELLLLNQKLEREVGEKEQLSQQSQELDLRYTALRTQQDEKMEAHATLLSIYQERQKSLAEQKDLIFELYSTTNRMDTEIQSLEQMQNSLRKRGEVIQLDQNASLPENEELKLQEAQVSHLIRNLEEEKSSLHQAYLEEQATSSDLAGRERLLSRDLEDLRVQIGQTASRKRTMEEMEQSYEGYHHAVRFVMKRENLSGIHGVVADLIQVPEGYEVAIETALGAALQNIVCEDDQSAQRAIQALKENKAGRITFLPLASIRAGRMQRDSGLAQAAGFRGYGSDCIRFDMKYQEIMEYLLGRVILVENLDQAVRLAKKAQSGLRFVTLDGEVVNAAGAITGGTVKQHAGNLLERKAETKRLAQELVLLEQKKSGLVTELERLTTSRQVSSARMLEQEQKLRQAELDLLRETNNLSTIVQKRADQELASQKWLRELAGIETESQSAQQMIQEIQTKAARERQAIAETEQKILDLTSRQEGEQEQVEQALEAVTVARLALTVVEAERNNIQQQFNRSLRDFSEMEKEQDSKLLELESIRQHRSRIDAEDGILAKEQQAVEQKKSAVEQRLLENQNKRTLAHSASDELQSRKEQQDELLFAVQNQKYEIQMKMEKNEAQMDALKDKLWEEFEISYLAAIDMKKKDFVMAIAQREAKELKSRIRALGEVNIGAIKEYETVKERYDFLSEQRTDLLVALESLQEIINDMDRTIQSNFRDSFNQIAANFGESFRALFGGGTAELRLEDENNPLESGIEIVAQPPGKKLQNMNLLSGGEKTMTAIALMFSVLKAKPTPFCILDEVEAALDDTNIQRFAGYLKNFREIQFTLVTHQKATMEYADVLYGVTMPERGISKVISLKLDDQPGEKLAQRG